jgi:DNA repair protein SbcD/Mre11
MLRIFHTADWHLGQTFHGFDREREHDRFLQWLLQMLRERKPDALFISGDVYDSINPPASAVRRFHDFLAQARAVVPQLQCVIIAGNHDAAARLEAIEGIYAALNIDVVGTVKRDKEGGILLEHFLVPLRNSSKEVAAIAVAIPFLRPSDVPLMEGAADPYLEGIRALYHRATEEAQAMAEKLGEDLPLLALGHCHISGAQETATSERRIIIGGAEALPRDTFPAELRYVALGHLHKPQSFEGGRICYAGSPLPLSFTEVGYLHQIREVNISDQGAISSSSVIIPQDNTELLRIPQAGHGRLDEVLQELMHLPSSSNYAPEDQPYLEVRVLLESPQPTLRSIIEQALVGKPVRLARIDVTRTETGFTTATNPVDRALSSADISALDPEELFGAAHEEEYGQPPEMAVLKALHDIMLGMNEGEKAA